MRHPQLIADACGLAAQHLYNKKTVEAAVVLRLLHTLLDEKCNVRDTCEMRIIGFIGSALHSIETTTDGEQIADVRERLTKLKAIALRRVESDAEVDRILDELQ